MKNRLKNKENTIVINVNDENVYGEYGYEGQEHLESSLVSTLQELAASRATKEQLTIKVKEKEGVNINNKQFVAAYKNTFNNLIDGKQHEISRCITTGVILLAISIVLISLYVFVFQNMHDLIVVFTDVISWIFTWCAIETLTIELIQLYIDRAKLKRLLNANIVIVQEEE